MHKCEEARLVLEEYFENDHERGTQSELRGEGEIEDQLHFRVWKPNLVAKAYANPFKTLSLPPCTRGR